MINPYYRIMTTRCKGCGEETKARYCNACETVQVFRGYTRGELKDAFESVQDSENWKNPISKQLGMLSASEKDRIGAAVVFYAGCEASFQRVGRGTLVTARGYYAAVGA